MYISQSVLVLMGDVAMAVWGAIVRYLFILQKREHNMRYLLAGISSAIFLGFLIFLSYSQFDISPKLSIAISGIVGYTGPSGIDLFRRVLLMKKFNLSKDDLKGDCDFEGTGKDEREFSQR